MSERLTINGLSLSRHLKWLLRTPTSLSRRNNSDWGGRHGMLQKRRTLCPPSYSSASGLPIRPAFNLTPLPCSYHIFATHAQALLLCAFTISRSTTPKQYCNSTIMAETSTDPITIPAAEGQPHEADPPIPSWGSGTAPSTPMVDDEEGLVSPMQGSIRRKWEMLIDTVQSDTDSAIDGMSAVFVRRGTTSSSLIL